MSSNDTTSKSLATKILTAGGLTAGMVVSGLAIAQVASAQTDSDQSDTDQSDGDQLDGDSTDLNESGEAESDGVSGKDEDCDGHRGHRSGAHGPRDRGAVADALGLTTEELRAEFEAGNSLADVAEAQGVDIDELVDLLMADAAERLDEAVENGRLTQEEADERLAERTERVTEKLDEVPDPEQREERRERRADRDRGMGSDA